MSESVECRPAHSTRLTIAIGIALTIVLVFGCVFAIVGPGNNAARSGPPTGDSLSAAAEVSADYYLAVKRDDTKTAYSLLCDQQQGSYSIFVAEVMKDIKTGTGVASFELTTDGRVSGVAAAVPANIALANGEQTPIIVLLMYDGARWRVCSSNLGGVLPGPGTSSGATSNRV